VLPASIAFTLIGLLLAGQSLNMMTLGGIAAAVGLVLDDGIVVVEHLAARSTDEHPATRSQAMAEIAPSSRARASARSRSSSRSCSSAA